MINVQQGRVNLWQLGAFVAACIFYNLVFVLGPQAILSTQANDALLVARLAREALYVSTQDGYYFVARIYAFLPEIARSITVYLIALWYIWEFFIRTKEPLNVALSLVLITAPIIMCLALFVKDTFAVIMILSVYHFVSKSSRTYQAVIMTAAFYMLGAFLVRPYYIFIICVFFVIISIRFRPKITIPVIVIAGIIILALMPAELAQQLQGSRDLYNIGKVGRELDGYRTSFMNPIPPSDGLSFSYNYVYAAVRLNLPFLFTGIGIKEIYLTFCVISSFALCIVAMKKNDIIVWLPASLYLSHAFVYILFEPDLGSYLRHLSTAFIYIVPALASVNLVKPFIPRHRMSTYSHKERSRW